MSTSNSKAVLAAKCQRQQVIGWPRSSELVICKAIQMAWHGLSLWLWHISEVGSPIVTPIKGAHNSFIMHTESQPMQRWTQTRGAHHPQKRLPPTIERGLTWGLYIQLQKSAWIALVGCCHKRGTDHTALYKREHPLPTCHWLCHQKENLQNRENV